MTALGVLCCFALFVCLTLLASFFLPSHLSFKTCTCTRHVNYYYLYVHVHVLVHTCMFVQGVNLCVQGKSRLCITPLYMYIHVQAFYTKSAHTSPWSMDNDMYIHVYMYNGLFQ